MLAIVYGKKKADQVVTLESKFIKLNYLFIGN